ncbi:MAG TPA: DinB family protein [Thermoplasmata archaeon]|nr:DinB family protein [Thermoplasmata archaeon]
MAKALEYPSGDARALVEYNRAVFERFVRRVHRLPRKDAWRDRGIGHGSLFDTLVHILHVQEVWLVYIVRGRNSDEELGALFEDARRRPSTWKEFDAYSARVWSGVEETVRSWTPRSLGRPVKAFWMPGRYTVRDALVQATVEEAHHLGEIIGALWKDDLSSPEMTWIDVRRTATAKPRARPRP